MFPFLPLGGYCWAYNTRLYFGKYYPDFDDQLGWWIFADSLVGGSFGVFFGGFFSDRIVKRLGLHSRLWVLSAFTLLSVPFACLTLYFEVSKLISSNFSGEKNQIFDQTLVTALLKISYYLFWFFGTYYSSLSNKRAARSY